MLVDHHILYVRIILLKLYEYLSADLFCHCGSGMSSYLCIKTGCLCGMWMFDLFCYWKLPQLRPKFLLDLTPHWADMIEFHPLFTVAMAACHDCGLTLCVWYTHGNRTPPLLRASRCWHRGSQVGDEAQVRTCRIRGTHLWLLQWQAFRVARLTRIPALPVQMQRAPNFPLTSQPAHMETIKAFFVNVRTD